MSAKGSQVSLREAPELPGIALASRIAKSFMVEEQGFRQPVLLDRMPSAVERETMQQRMVELGWLLRPARNDKRDEARVRAAIAVMLNCYASTRNSGEAGINGVWIIAAGQPAIGMIRACELAAEGRIPGVDTEWPPATPTLMVVARKYVEPLRLEQALISKILHAKGTIQDATSDGEARARVAAMAQEFKARVAAMELNDPERQAMRHRQKLANEGAVIEEWRALGRSPIVKDGLMLSPSLARSLGLLT